ncbi:MAG: aspartate/glutamate racemase family protein [Pseudomonadota bacterium]
MPSDATTEIPASTPVAAPYELDAGPGRHRIGLICLASDYATERDFINMRPSDQVTVFTSRVRNVNPVTVENLRTMTPRLEEAAGLIVPDGRLDAIAYSCTSATVAIGYEAVAEVIRRARPGIPVITPITAAVAGLEALGCRRIAVLTPYLDEVNGPMRRCLEDHGQEVVGFTSFGIADDNDMARLAPETIYQAALEADRAEAEALFISCTAIRAAEVAARLEAALGKPVVTSIQAMYWQALRAAGYQEPVTGYGQLLERAA